MGLKCVAAPIMNYKNVSVGSISISGPTSRMNDERVDLISKDIKYVAVKISETLGYKMHCNN